MHAPGLTLCRCGRHVRRDETRCPFCTSKRAIVLVASATVATAALACCGPRPVPAYGAPEPLERTAPEELPDVAEGGGGATAIDGSSGEGGAAP